MKDFVPKPQALELKELGFDEPCIAFYSDNDIPKAIDQRWGSSVQTISKSLGFSIDDITLAPTFEDAFRWFREKHNIDAWVQPFVSEKQNGKPFLPDESYAYYIFEDGVYVADGVNFLDSEEAEMACIKKLIDHCKN
jgi:hypothetical protein